MVSGDRVCCKAARSMQPGTDPAQALRDMAQYCHVLRLEELHHARDGSEKLPVYTLAIAALLPEVFLRRLGYTLRFMLLSHISKAFQILCYALWL